MSAAVVRWLVAGLLILAACFVSYTKGVTNEDRRHLALDAKAAAAAANNKASKEAEASTVLAKPAKEYEDEISRLKTAVAAAKSSSRLRVNTCRPNVAVMSTGGASASQPNAAASANGPGTVEVDITGTRDRVTELDADREACVIQLGKLQDAIRAQVNVLNAPVKP